MIKIILSITLFTLSILSSAERCEISNNPNRSEVHTVQQCLKSEIKKSIELGQQYDKYHKDVEEALKIYYEEYDMCVGMYAKYINSRTKIRKEQYNECLVQLNYSSNKLRRLERQYSLLSSDYIIFKSSIEELKSTLQLLKMKHRRLLEN